ncbi:MAG: STAS/SEC14 domain-containing protein [Bacteroidales bacterium]
MEQKQIEVKQISEREIQVGENRVYLGEDNIIFFTAVGEHSDKMAAKINEAIIKLGDTVKGKVNLFVDLSKAGKSSPEARKIWQKSSEYEKAGKTALVGLHPVARVLASFVMGVSRKQDMRFFKTKEEALAWLKE